MTEAEENPIRQSQLHNRLVIDLETTEELGKLSQFLVDITQHQLEGFICRQGLLGLNQIPIMWVQVESIGNDSILVRRSGNVVSERFDGALVLENQAVWSDSGNKVGNLADYCLDLKTGAVTQYAFAMPGWQGLTEGLYTFQPEDVISIGQKRIMVRQIALDNAPQFIPGVQERVVDFLQNDASQTRADMQGAVDNTREAAEQVQEQTKKLSDQAKTQFGQILGQAKQRSRQLRSQVNEGFADAASNIQKSKSGNLPDQSSETAINIDPREIWQDEPMEDEETQ